MSAWLSILAEAGCARVVSGSAVLGAWRHGSDRSLEGSLGQDSSPLETEPWRRLDDKA